MAPADLVSEGRLRASFRAHAVTAQLYRMASQGERTVRAIDGRQIVACEIAPESGSDWSFTAQLGEGDGYLDALAPAGEIAGVATFDGAVLPVISALRIETAQLDAGSVNDARIRALVHFFFSLVENPARDPAPFHALLADTFSLELVEQPLETLDAIDAWVRGRLASVVASEHALREIAIEPVSVSKSRVRIVMKSQALFPDGSGAISRNTQLWTVRERAGEQLPAIEHIAIERDGVVFFGPAPDYALRTPPTL